MNKNGTQLSVVFSLLLFPLSLSGQWYTSPDYNLFGPYVEHRKLHPSQPFYILHPSYVWRLWDVIQGNTQENIQPNPPSSGFIGQYKHIHAYIQLICMQLMSVLLQLPLDSYLFLACS